MKRLIQLEISLPADLRPLLQQVQVAWWGFIKESAEGNFPLDLTGAAITCQGLLL